MRSMLILSIALSLVFAGCNGAAIDRLKGDDDKDPSTRTESTFTVQNRDKPSNDLDRSIPANVTINEIELSEKDLEALNAYYQLQVESGDYWYDPISGAWGYWGGPTAGFLAPYMEIGSPPIYASGGGTGIVLNGRELHPTDVAGLAQIVGFINPGYYWLDANGYFGYEGGQALGNIIHAAQSGSASSNGYYESTYFGNIGSDGQSSYFYDSSTGCSVMSDGGLSC